MRKLLIFVWEITKMVVISLAIIIPVRYFLIQPFYVKGASMEPNFHDHEYLIIDEISYRFNEPQRGDIIVFRYPFNPQEFFIKRLIGLPGETVQLRDGHVYVTNTEHPEGWQLPETYLDVNLQTNGFDQSSVELSADQYFVLGDNRYASKDSRSFGPVAKNFIIGRVFFRGWPFSKIQLFEGVDYPLDYQIQ
ncbi:MAG: Signal peptidase I [Candidatus Falkowbacteria bacterium GW2011_GWA2_39_24]|uniref:Signal peptidase I n=1 Tax=Candidatus Falkowbacteria bacterium GW2011_GWA2_39_24 TaxID=1618634 RepID=A0A0G0QXZ3_9BACT|nr:MAG: Signal peptidase I [Candidatus Falkowbacteria bacterium GW2011_GWA2_39_24]